jgi:hypothetical protein
MGTLSRKINKKTLNKSKPNDSFEYYLAVGVTDNKIIFNLEEVPKDEIENMFDSVHNRIMQDGYLWIDGASPQKLIYLCLTQEDGLALQRVGYSLTDFSNVFRRYMDNGGLTKGSFTVNFAESNTPTIFKESTF